MIFIKNIKHTEYQIIKNIKKRNTTTSFTAPTEVSTAIKAT